MEAFVKTINNSYCFVETEVGRVFVQANECDFMMSELEVGDELDLEKIIDTARGLRAAGVVRWLSRPRDNAEEVAGTIVTMNGPRGFCFARPDSGGVNVFLNVRDFTDYRFSGSATFQGLIPGDRVIFSRVAGHPGPQGKHIRAESGVSSS